MTEQRYRKLSWWRQLIPRPRAPMVADWGDRTIVPGVFIEDQDGVVHRVVPSAITLLEGVIAARQQR